MFGAFCGTAYRRSREKEQRDLVNARIARSYSGCVEPAPSKAQNFGRTHGPVVTVCVSTTRKRGFRIPRCFHPQLYERLPNPDPPSLAVTTSAATARDSTPRKIVMDATAGNPSGHVRRSLPVVARNYMTPSSRRIRLVDTAALLPPRPA